MQRNSVSGKSQAGTAVAGIILAAGKGTRMKSEMPKGLHSVGGLPMVEWVGRAMREAGVERPIVVVGHGGDALIEQLGDGYDYVWQREQLGTGHAALMARDLLANHQGMVLVAPGDAPLVSSKEFSDLIETQIKQKAAVTVVTAILKDPRAYGRIVRNEQGAAIKIVEEKDATPDQKEIKEINVSLYAFDRAELFSVLPALKNSNAQGEYYLTDVLEAISLRGGKVSTMTTEDPGAMVGVNDRWQLAEADRDLNLRTLKRHALAGVTLQDFQSIRIEPDVVIGLDTHIEGGTHLLGNTVIGSQSRIGPNCRIENSQVGDKSVVVMSHLQNARVGRRVWCGPFANLRPGSNLGDGVKIGNFVEIKQSVLGEGAKVSHLSYIGDSTIGAESNVGAGTITCNYDGFQKHQTVIGADVFVGSNSTLVAPITIGDGAIIAAGSVITQDVPAGAGAFGRARQETKEEWASQWRRKKQSKSQLKTEA